MKRKNKRIKRITGYSPVRSSSVNTDRPHSPPAIPRQRVQHKTPCESPGSPFEKHEENGYSLFSKKYGTSVVNHPRSTDSTISGSSSGHASSSESQSNFSGTGSNSNVGLLTPNLPESQEHQARRRAKQATQSLLTSIDINNQGPRNGQGNSSVASVDEDEDDLLHEFSRLGYKDYRKVCEAYDRERKEAMQASMDSKDRGPASTKTSF